MEDGEAARLIDDILSWVDRPEYIYTHQWTLGGVIVWDNRGGTFHTGKLDYPLNERRRMYRTTVAATADEYCQN